MVEVGSYCIGWVVLGGCQSLHAQKGVWQISIRYGSKMTFTSESVLKDLASMHKQAEWIDEQSCTCLSLLDRLLRLAGQTEAYFNAIFQLPVLCKLAPGLTISWICAKCKSLFCSRDNCSHSRNHHKERKWRLMIVDASTSCLGFRRCVSRSIRPDHSMSQLHPTRPLTLTLAHLSLEIVRPRLAHVEQGQ